MTHLKNQADCPRIYGLSATAYLNYAEIAGGCQGLNVWLAC